MFSQYTDILLRENKKYNLTAITQPEEIQQKHFEDSLALLHDAPDVLAPEASLLDVGSGAGFPGVPLCIARPDLRVTLLEATGKKAAFLRLLAQELGLHYTVLHARAEEAAHNTIYREQFDVVTARAVAALPLLCELCLPFVKTGGVFVAYKGPRENAEAEAQAAGSAIAKLGGKLRCIHSETTAYGGRSRIMIGKISPVPTQYPRNYGVMQKRPL